MLHWTWWLLTLALQGKLYRALQPKLYATRNLCITTTRFFSITSVSAGFRWWGAWIPGVVGGPMRRYTIFRWGMIDEVTSISPNHWCLWRNLVTSHLLTQLLQNFMLQYGIWQWTAICKTVAKPVTRNIASNFCNFVWKKFWKSFWKKFLGDPTFSSSLNSSSGSLINFTTETKRCRRKRFPILFTLIGQTG